MKKPLLLVLLMAITVLPLHAEPPKIEHIIDLLQQAKTADKPLPLLHDAKEKFAGFDPVNGHQLTAEGVGSRKKAVIEVAGQERKREAMDAIGAAIEAAKDRSQTTQRYVNKVENAIAKVHFAGSLKH